jgi:hemoglobin-like flavoprotein
MNKGLVSLTARQVGLLKKSFRQLDTHWVATNFYSRLFERHPYVRPLFPTDTSELASKLMSVFELVVFSFEEKKQDQYMLQEPLIVPLRELGRKHETKGVKAEHYEIANSLLLETIRDGGKDFFTKEVEDAWKLALDLLATAMQDRSVKTTGIYEGSGNTLRDTFAYIRKKLLKNN